MNHNFIFTDVYPSPHGPLTAEYQSFPPSIPVNTMLGHFSNFDINEFVTWQKRNILPKDSKKFITYFIHMPEPITFEFGDDIVHELQTKSNTYFLIFSMLERVITPEDLSKKLKEKGIPLNKVIVCCSDKISHNKKIEGVLYLYVEFWESYTRYHQHFMKGSTELDPEERAKSINKAQKKFLCLNRNIKAHRIWLYYLMLRRNITDQGHVSFHLPKVSKPEFLWLANDPMTTKYIPQNLHDEYKRDIKRRLLPKVLDRLDREHIINYKETIKPYYKDSLVSVITESDFRWPFVTEKTYKAIAHCHPFFIVGDPSHHSMLKEAGYYTFENFFGVEKVMNWNDASTLLDNINNMSLDDMKKKVKEMMPMVEHNYYNFFNRRTDWKEIKRMLEMVTA